MPISTQKTRRPLRWLLALVMAGAPFFAVASMFQVSVDTTPLAGQSGYIAFDLYQGTPGAPNSVVVSSFSTSSALGSANMTGKVVGDLATSVTLRSTTFFNEFLQAVVFGAGVTSFQLDLTELVSPGSIPDSFSLFLLNSAFVP